MLQMSGWSEFIKLIYYSSVNTCQNQVKLCTLKVQVDVQFTISTFYLSIKDFWSQASFKNFTIKGLGPKNYCNDPNF